jgi:hypothetical protein
VVQADVPHLVAEDEPQSLPVVVVQVGEQLVGQHDVVVARCLRGERVQRPVAVRQEDLRPSPQAQRSGEVVGDPVQVGELALRELHRASADRSPLGLADHDEGGDEQQQPDQSAPDPDPDAGFPQLVRHERQHDRSQQDRRDGDDVEDDHDDEERALGRVSQHARLHGPHWL